MTNGFNLPKEMTEAVLAVMKELKSLAKTEKNQHGGYNFAPVDDFYDAVHELLPQNGLLLTSEEIDSELFPMENATYDKNGNVTARKVTVWIKSTWIFKLHHNGVSSEGFKRFVWVPTAGPQTAGIVQSYASKNFMRDLFKIRTGEYELDDMAPDPHGTPVNREGYPNASKPTASSPTQTKASEVKTGSKELATDIFKDILSPNVTTGDIDNLESEIKKNEKDGKLESRHVTALNAVLAARKQIHLAKTPQDIEVAKETLSKVPTGFTKAKDIGDLNAYLAEKEVVINATSVTA